MDKINKNNFIIFYGWNKTKHTCMHTDRNLWITFSVFHRANSESVKNIKRVGKPLEQSFTYYKIQSPHVYNLEIELTNNKQARKKRVIINNCILSL